MGQHASHLRRRVTVSGVRSILTRGTPGRYGYGLLGRRTTVGRDCMLGVAIRYSGEAMRTYFERLRSLLADVPETHLDSVVDMLLKARNDGRRVYVVGNGGSASTATHFVCDLQKSATETGEAPKRAI